MFTPEQLRTRLAQLRFQWCDEQIVADLQAHRDGQPGRAPHCDCCSEELLAVGLHVAGNFICLPCVTRSMKEAPEIQALGRTRTNAFADAPALEPEKKSKK